MGGLFGNAPTNEDLPFAQQFYYLGFGLVGNSSASNYGIGSFVMPWAGTLFASFTVVVSWPGHQHVQARLLYSSPNTSACSVAMVIGLCDYTNQAAQLPAYGYWANLVKGQVVNLAMYCEVGGGGNTANFEACGGTVRAVRD
jgi:hypothetical protein